MCKISIHSTELVNDLILLNIVPRKSCVLQWTKNIPEEYKYDYIRGFMDGDGSVSIRTRNGKMGKTMCLVLGFCGGESFIERLAIEINKDLDLNIKYYKNKFLEKKKVWFTSISHRKNAEKILDKIYENVINHKTDFFYKENMIIFYYLKNTKIKE